MLERRKLSMTTGFWANDGMNDDKGTRKQALDELDEQFEQAVEMVYAGATTAEAANVLTAEDEDNPFLAPAIKATREIEAPRDDEGSVKDAIDADRNTDFSTDQD